MMISTYQSNSSVLPRVVALSTALAAGEITPREYNGALRVAEMDVKKPFCVATWADVEVGDVILVPGDGEPIVEVTVKEVRRLRTDDGTNLVNVCYRLGYAKYTVPCDPEGVAYVQSRF